MSRRFAGRSLQKRSQGVLGARLFHNGSAVAKEGAGVSRRGRFVSRGLFQGHKAVSALYGRSDRNKCQTTGLPGCSAMGGEATQTAGPTTISQSGRVIPSAERRKDSFRVVQQAAGFQAVGSVGGPSSTNRGTSREACNRLREGDVETDQTQSVSVVSEAQTGRRKMRVL